MAEKDVCHNESMLGSTKRVGRFIRASCDLKSNIYFLQCLRDLYILHGWFFFPNMDVSYDLHYTANRIDYFAIFIENRVFQPRSGKRFTTYFKATIIRFSKRGFKM